MEQMGHNSINVTVDIYGHLVPGGNRQAVDRLDDSAVSGSDGKTAAAKKKEVWKHSMETIGKKIRFDGRKLLKVLARPEGFEPPTLRSEV